MGAVLDFGKKAVDKAKEAKEWCWNHSDEIIEYTIDLGVHFLAGIGLGTLFLEVTGITDATYKGEYTKGLRKGYDTGFNDGMSSAANLLAKVNGKSQDSVNK